MQNNEYAFTYPGDENGKALFYELEELSKQNKYDDDYLLNLIEYQKLCPKSPNFDIFYAKYALFYGNHDVALEYATKAEKIFRMNMEIWKILAVCYKALDMTLKGCLYTGLCTKLGEAFKDLRFSSDEEERKKELIVLSEACGVGDYMPNFRLKFSLDNGEFTTKENVYFAGELLPIFEEVYEPYFVGAYIEEEWASGKGVFCNIIKEYPNITLAVGEFIFDLIRAHKAQETVAGEKGKKIILPVSGLSAEQKVNVSTAGDSGEIILGKWSYSFLRLEEETRLSSEKPFIIGKPILLEHSPKRKKVVINILADAMPWAVIKRNNYEWTPNIMKFFSKGVIFDNQFSASEYTYPSLVTLETGMYPVNHKIQGEKYSVALPNNIKTVSEQMNSLGYYCTHLVGGGVYNGATRGYDRQIVNSYATHSYIATERIIRQLEAFDECDNFIMVHFMDTHPLNKKGYSPVLDAQTHLPLQDKICVEKSSASGIDLPCSPYYESVNIRAIKMLDRTLKTLFDYLEEHYSDDEYIVQLYSDHGNFVHSAERYMLKEDQTNATYLVRGAGVPSIGHVDELTSTADIYAVLGYLAGYEMSENVDGNLPEVFGGKRREHVISSSVFPGQTYKLCIRTDTHEFRLESREFTDWDCTADLTNACCELYDRRTKEQVAPTDEQRAYFLGLVQKYTKERDNHGHVFSSIRWKKEAKDGSKKE